MTYDLASVSKVVGVGTLATFLVNSGALELDRTLQSYYPAFADSEVTIRQLLTHTSGIDPFIPNRDSLDADQLKEAILKIAVTDKKAFLYTDINFLLLGFLLEELGRDSLDQLISRDVLEPFGMFRTSFGPVSQAVPTVRGVKAGVVHDPKARVLGLHAGSAGLFSTVKDLEIFLERYLTEDFAANLTQDYGFDDKRKRSLAWDKKGDWLSHTGYTGTFIMYNRPLQKAAIFLSNRTFDKDERAQWKLDRNQVMALIRQVLEEEEAID
ncbi:Beta-lactamase [Streptococcus suis]|uniref:Beta-lactamase n=1 Tax=Streptococcus suis TaxID=1307 RepID=A0A2K1T2J3_STRSU|nr:Beta-lactamase class C and other penicillin binding proteins [Streptococcus suis 05ZYH33]ABP91358.1 Beta-lactamase class C and other penicillin binding proteins [Streptococcus suis 98HAH33]ADV69301.1 Beta-lactamase class C-like penicillin binding protein [Streptococcus suis JS14]AER14390.1 Beta-lactamase class C-related penicillin binding protein [Streptococcus suis SS12]AER43524.1 Beta-lactamase class C-like penicillin binding protein [Streptococcus suis A7]AFQ99692.1 Beta-lactamase class 